jgi:hypothetical protein
LLPLQGFAARTRHIPICVPSLLLPLLLSPEEVESEDACVFIIIADTDNESRLVPLLKIKT